MFWEVVSGGDVINTTKYQTDFWSVGDVGVNKGTRLLNSWSLDNQNSTSDLITFCQTKLKSTEAEVNKIINQMENLNQQ